MSPLTTPQTRPYSSVAGGFRPADSEATTVLPPRPLSMPGPGSAWASPVAPHGGPQGATGGQPPTFWAPPTAWVPAPPQRNDRRRWLLAAGGVTAAVAVVVGLLAATTSGPESTTRTAESAPGVSVPPLPTKTPRTAPSAPTASAGTVADSAVPTLLPDIASLNRIMGTDALAVMPELTGTRMYTDTSTPPQCLGLVVSGARDAYAGAPWRATANQTSKDPKGSPSPHLVFNAVSTFSTPAAAADYVNRQLPLWQGCAANPITLNPDDHPLTWITNDVAMHGQSLTALVQPRNSSVSCQRALTAVQNVVVDVEACSVGATNQAETITAAITALIHP
ncbi:sensor domain-containing protein [Mycolicibacterium sp. Dal123E01]|uniref:sensor domain-containing protein n=1 Tax=Mycolicibacterium sp. Dal123E01 TaxID=3457578 RepID=UPI00403E57F6